MVNTHETKVRSFTGPVGNQENNLAQMSNSEARQLKSFAREIEEFKKEINCQKQKIKTEIISEWWEEFPRQIEQPTISNEEALPQLRVTLVEMKELYERFKQEFHERTTQERAQMQNIAYCREEYEQQRKNFISHVEASDGKLAQQEARIHKLFADLEAQETEGFKEIQKLMAAAISQQVKRLEQQVENIGSQIQEYSDQNDTVLAKLKALEEMQTATSETVRAFSRHLEQQDKKLTQVKKQGKRQSIFINNKFCEHANKIAELGKPKDTLEADSPTTPNAINYRASCWKGLPTLADELKEAHELSAQIKELAEERQHLKGCITLLQEKSADQGTRLTTCETNIAQAQDNQKRHECYRYLSTRLGETEKHRTQLTLMTAAARLQVDELSRRFEEDLPAKFAELESRLSTDRRTDLEITEKLEIFNKNFRTLQKNKIKVLEISAIAAAPVAVTSTVLGILANLGKLPVALSSQASSLNMVAAASISLCIMLGIMLISSKLEDAKIEELQTRADLEP